jgi:malate synthase
MTEKRFTYLNTTGWNKDGFLNVMNGLNEKNKKLQKENEQIKNVIREAYETERTELGKSVLKQLLEQIQ